MNGNKWSSSFIFSATEISFYRQSTGEFIEHAAEKLTFQSSQKEQRDDGKLRTRRRN